MHGVCRKIKFFGEKAMKDVANIFKLSPKDLQKKSKSLWEDTAPEIVDFANNLQDFLQDVDTPYVIGLDGGYGTGKTHFSTRFAVQMHKKIRTLYFSAWENDYKNDPLSIFVEQIALLVKQEQKVIKPKTFQSIRRLLSSWACATELNVGVQVKGVSVGATTNLGKFIDNLKNLELPVDVLQNAKSQLAEYIKLLPHDKLIFIVDDLDRCRPDFAIKTLEAVKHFFDIEGLIVVMPINQNRLRICVEAFYQISSEARQKLGNKEDYLQKFFNEIIDIPNLNYEKICSDNITQKEFVKNLVYEGNDFNSIIELQKWIAEYAKKCNFSYRETVEIIKKAKFFCNNYNEPIRCRLLAYTLCNRLHRQKGRSWGERTDIQYGDNNVYADNQQNPRNIIFRKQPAYPILNHLKNRFRMPVEFDPLVIMAGQLPKTYAELYEINVKCYDGISRFAEKDFLNNSFYYNQIKPRLQQVLPDLEKQKQDAEKLQKEHGSDDNDMERAKNYANLVQNPQLLKK